MEYAYKLNLPFEFTPEIAEEKWGFIVRYRAENKELNKFLNGLGLSVLTAQQIYLGPGEDLFIHIDNAYFNDYTKLNFIFGGANSYINWYEPVNDNPPVIESAPWDAGIRYLRPASNNDVQKVSATQTSHNMILNPGHYHKIINPKEIRITYSYQIKDNSLNTHLPWHHAIDIFSKYITEIPVYKDVSSVKDYKKIKEN